MSEVIITVRGESETRVTAERATVHLAVRTDGADRPTAVEAAMRFAETLRASITARHGSGTIAEWTSKRLSVTADRPWNSEGKRLAPVFSASISFTATFTDASELSVWVSEISAWDGVEVGVVDWHLTSATRARVEGEVAAAAVGVAVARARSYAQALGLTEVTPVEIADAGLISTGPEPQAKGMMRAMAMDAVGSAPTMEYEPDEIAVGATVEARFSAS